MPWGYAGVFQLGCAGKVYRRRQRGDRSVLEEGGAREGFSRRGVPGSARGRQPGTDIAAYFVQLALKGGKYDYGYDFLLKQYH